ncbi:hypothetical protein L1887_02001 [Cichorium endivia]|nr:hypothetical protein L1887_02001 [Cichorium endivia]
MRPRQSSSPDLFFALMGIWISDEGLSPSNARLLPRLRFSLSSNCLQFSTTQKRRRRVAVYGYTIEDGCLGLHHKRRIRYEATVLYSRSLF